MDRQELVRAGSLVITPVIEFTNRIGPVGASFGSQDEIQDRLKGWDEEWDRLRTPLLTYANAHPSDEVRQLANELPAVITAAIGAAWYLSYNLADPSTLDAYQAASGHQTKAHDLADRLLSLVRSY